MGDLPPPWTWRPEPRQGILRRMANVSLVSFRNVSTLDRVIRVLLGLFMLWAGWSGAADGLWQVALRIFAWVPLVTGLIGWCPLYIITGISTYRPRASR